VSNLARNVLVLLSGGIDSCACVSYYIAQGASVSALFVDYGQISSQREANAALKICKYYNIPLNKITVSGLKSWLGGYVPGRNAFLLYTGMMSFQDTTGTIALGIHAGTNYNDCSQEFIQTMQLSFDLYTDGCIRVPFINLNKLGVWNYCKSENIPIELTYSCELGKEQPCGDCLSCKDLEILHAS
jgi:7-cyano-7-deazaguanine synthase